MTVKRNKKSKTQPDPNRKRKKTGLIIGIVSVVLLAAIVGAVLIGVSRNQAENVPDEKPTDSEDSAYTDSQKDLPDDNAAENGAEKDGNETDSDGFVLKNSSSVAQGTSQNKITPQTVYQNLSYVPEMFYGQYTLGDKDAQENFGSQTPFFTWTKDGKDVEFSTLPYRITAGKHSVGFVVTEIPGYNWMKLDYMRRYSETDTHSDSVFCAYTIEGNKLTLRVLDTFSLDEGTNKIEYSFTDQTWEYTFAFSGRHLTISDGNDSVVLVGALDVYEKYDLFQTDAYLSSGSERIGNIDAIQFRYDSESGNARLYFTMKDGKIVQNAIGELKENGLFTFTLPLESGTKTYSLVYFYGRQDGLVLTDGTKNYYYNDSFSDRNRAVLRNYLTEDQTDLSDKLTDAQLEAVIEKKENLMDDLVKAFRDAGISVTVNSATGELAVDSSVLFGGDSAALTSDGKSFLNRFIEVYTTTAFSEKYKGFISKTMVEGHTAPVAGSTEESSMALSRERAENVRDYCISSETGVDISALSAAFEAVGFADSKPIIDDNGNVDMAASRRVSFRFIIDLDQAV